MESDRNIGRVLNVDSFRVVIEIDKENKSLTKTHYYGIHPVARINSYVIIPVGFEKIVGHITKVQMFSEATQPSNKATITLPDVKRLVWATMIGTIKKKGELEEFEQGITSFPSLDNPVQFVLKDELDIIFDKKASFSLEDYQQDKKKYYVPIGKSTTFSEYEVKIDPDALFSKHLAVLGNTGSGKSCTIASLLQTLLAKEFHGNEKIKNAHFIILDTNGEYGNVFAKQTREGKTITIGDCLRIDIEGLKIPYWFMNFEDFKTIFRATEGSQAPVLNTALVLAKERSSGTSPITLLLLMANELKTIYDILLSADADWKRATDINSHCHAIENMINSTKSKLSDYFDEQDIKIDIEEIKKQIQGLLVSTEISGKYFKFNSAFNPNTYTEWYESNAHVFESSLFSFEDSQTMIDADMPIYFEKSNFVKDYLNPAMRIEGRENSRIREYCSTLILRMNSLFKDERYKILFDDYKNFPYALATFLRYCFGRMEKAKMDEFGKDMEGQLAGSPPFFEYYLEQIGRADSREGTNHQVVIFDLSLLASDILENVTALLGRLILEFLQRMGKDKQERGKFPVVLILEEAHNYIPETKMGAYKESISKIVFEKIAREGRKYGLSLVVASQRPSELSRTVLSQCNSFIVHRIQNPEDQKYIQTIVPSVNEDLLKQLPSLAQRTALVFGDCVRAPAQVYINEANPLPDSKDPKFMRHWLNLEKEGKEEPDFEAICEEWEGKPKNPTTNQVDQETCSSDTHNLEPPSPPLIRGGKKAGKGKNTGAGK